MSSILTGELRRLHRAVSRTFGMPESQQLEQRRHLSECRLICEIGTGGAEVRTLRAALGLSSPYLSKLLRSLESQALIITRKTYKDQRVRRVELTNAGLDEFHEINRVSEDLAETIIHALSKTDQLRLSASVAEVERLLLSAQATIDEVNSPH